jgi:predicted transcriptional regulator
MRSLKEIKYLRRKFNLTQKQLADKANVSQSLITKIESGKLDPTYNKAKSIFTALQDLEEKQELKAKDLLNKKIVSSRRGELLTTIIKKMKQQGISQIPVFESDKNSKVIGIITEVTILKEIAERPDKIVSLKVEEIMEEVPPIVSLTMCAKNLISLLRSYPMVLVAEKGNVKGIISKSDLFGVI